MRHRIKVSQASRSYLTQTSTLSFKGFSVNRPRPSSAMPSRAQTAVFAKSSSRPRVPGVGVDQRLIVQSSPVPLAVVNGGADRFVKLDYFDSVAYANLWEGRCHRLSALGHAPFLEAPGDFNPVLERFLQDIEAGRACTTKRSTRK